MTNRNPGVSRVGRAALLAFGFLCVFVSATSRSVVGADDLKKIAWREDLGQAQVEAKTRDLLLWIQFTGPWCVNCRRMERSAFAHAPIIAESRERFVPVKLRSDEYESLAQTLGLTMLPSTVIVRPNGEVIDKFEGYGEPEVFEKFLATSLTQEGRSPEQIAAKQRIKAEKDSAIGLAGYDPVTLLQDQKLVPGRPDLVVEHQGRVFRFANEAARDAFLQRPDSFAPVNGGRCPVSQVDRGDFANGDPRWGVVYNGHLFLFKEVADRDRFAKDPERYAGLDQSVRTTCPHCRDRTSLARRFTSRFSTMFASTVPGGTTSAAASPPPSTVAERLSSLLALDSILRR